MKIIAGQEIMQQTTVTQSSQINTESQKVQTLSENKQQSSSSEVQQSKQNKQINYELQCLC